MKYIMNKKGQVIDTISNTALGIMTLFFIIFAVLFGIAALNVSTFFGAGTLEQNVTQQAQANITTGVGNVTSYVPTVFTVLGVVLAIAGVFLLILYVRRLQGGGGAGGL